MSTDEELMLEFQRGSKEAFLELFERYREPIYGFFRRRMQHVARAEELTQETFLAVLRGIARYEPRALVRTYLYGIALNLVAAERRKKGQEAADPGACSDPLINENVDSVLWVREALARLDSEERQILMLREYEQLRYDEIAGLLHIPINTVRSRLFRARMALRDLLTADGAAQRGY